MSAHKHTKLNEFFATAICGNDILSSCLYVSGIAILFSGVFAPLVLLLVAVVLYFYKAVYTEVVEALPINGGAYNCLLNATSKVVAAIAGVMTILSYIATAVISAKIAVEYVHTLVEFPVIPATIFLLLFFAILVISGIKDSALVAFGIFVFHIITLSLVVLYGVMAISSGHSVFSQNILATQELIVSQGGLWKSLFLAFSASLLGISGFESSANFVEEQQPGVFRKTLRNMLLGVGIFNPLIAFVVLGSLSYPAITGAKDFLLSDVAHAIGGPIFQYVIVADAFLVLSGAVLTSYVGVSGLMSRMTADGCLPDFLDRPNGRGSYPLIILLFFGLCSSILFLTGGNLLSLAGVYTIAFLGVMCLFAFGNMILRQTRTELKRTYRAPIVFVTLAFLATFLGIIGNAIIDRSNVMYFALYFLPTAAFVVAMVYQDNVFRFLLQWVRPFPPLHRFLLKNFREVLDGTFVAFIHNTHRLHEILFYLSWNETGRNLILVFCENPDDPTSHKTYEEIVEVLPALKKAGVYPHIRIELLKKQGTFGPEMIRTVAKELGVRENRVLIGSIHHHHSFDYEDLGGVRIIF